MHLIGRKKRNQQRCRITCRYSYKYLDPDNAHRSSLFAWPHRISSSLHSVNSPMASEIPEKSEYIDHSRVIVLLFGSKQRKIIANNFVSIVYYYMQYISDRLKWFLLLCLVLLYILVYFHTCLDEKGIFFHTKIFKEHNSRLYFSVVLLPWSGKHFPVSIHNLLREEANILANPVFLEYPQSSKYFGSWEESLFLCS